MSKEEKSAPMDFYVFEGHIAPAVIHFPLFSIVNCDDKGNVQLLLNDCSMFNNNNNNHFYI